MRTANPIYHIGDIHGRNDLLSGLLGWIEADARDRGGEPCVVFLGDVVDRGPDSMACMDTVMATLRRWKESRLILGNHDEWFLDAVLSDGKSSSLDGWVLNGGIATIESYCGGEIDPEVARLVRERHPGHVDMLKAALRIIPHSGPFVAVHAGIDPTLPLHGQKERDLNWIRDRFLAYVGTDIRPVVHGHTIVGRLPVVTENRVSIDTGAYDHGLLTCFAVDPEEGDVRFMQASEDGLEAVEPHLVDRGYGTVLDRLPELFASAPAPEPAL